MKDIVIIGGGGHAKSVADTIERTGEYRILGYTDPEDKKWHDYPYLGNDQVLETLKDKVRYLAFGLGYLGENTLRDRLYQYVKGLDYELPPIIDPSAIISTKAVVEEGTFIGKGVVVNIDARIGRMSIINTRTVVEHDNLIGPFSHLAVNVIMCGNVRTGSHVFIGANTTVIQGVSIGDRTIIGANSLVLHDMTKDEKSFGII